jgi:hypothetical protein
MGLGYAEQHKPTPSQLGDVAAIRGRGLGARGRREDTRKMTAGRVTSTAALESQKRKAESLGRGLKEPADVIFGREIAGKVGKSKKVVIGKTCHFSQVWSEMVVFCPLFRFSLFMYLLKW